MGCNCCGTRTSALKLWQLLGRGCTNIDCLISLEVCTGLMQGLSSSFPWLQFLYAQTSFFARGWCLFEDGPALSWTTDSNDTLEQIIGVPRPVKKARFDCLILCVLRTAGEVDFVFRLSRFFRWFDLLSKDVTLGHSGYGCIRGLGSLAVGPVKAFSLRDSEYKGFGFCVSCRQF